EEIHSGVYFSAGKLTGRFDTKNCSSSKCSPLSFSASLGNNIEYVYEQKCCESELCNQEELKVPQKSSNPNGITCPACYSEKRTSCDPVPLACTGAETKCVKVVASGMDISSGSLLSGDTEEIVMKQSEIRFAMGCATETACNLKNVTVLFYSNITTTCESSGAPLLTSITSWILTGLFLFKVLL
ncbi:Protein RoBo-1, partial [Galemys pyrenaicus]